MHVHHRLRRRQARFTPGTPQGRLTLESGTPVIASDQSGKTTIYYTPYKEIRSSSKTGRTCSRRPFRSCRTSRQTAVLATPGRPLWAANSNYDLFVWSNGGTITLSGALLGPPTLDAAPAQAQQSYNGSTAF